MTELEQTLLNSLRALDAERESAQKRMDSQQSEIEDLRAAVMQLGDSVTQLTRSQSDLAKQLTEWQAKSKS